MKIRIDFIEIFNKISEGLAVKNSIVSYGKIKMDISGKYIIYRNILMINLWLLIIHLDWESREEI